MKLKVDIHIHSHNSHDGSMTINEIVNEAKRKKIDVIAICDHNKLFTDNINYNDITIIRGIEFSTEYGHLIGLFLNKDIKKNNFKDIVDSIHQQGGIAILAHPFQKKIQETKLLEIISYIDGIEVWNSRANRKYKLANQKALEFAKKYNLKFFAGSDAHLKEEVGNSYFTIEINKENLKKSLLSEPIKIFGLNSPSVYSAKSQYNKLIKEKKGYIKWFLFYLKCILEDIIRTKEKKYVIISENRKKDS